MSFSRAEKFIEEKESWLRRNLAKITYAEKSFTVFDFDTNFHTVDHSLKIVRMKDEKPVIKLNGGEIQVLCPEGRDIKGE